MHYFFQAFYTTDPTFDGVFFSAWTQVELAFSVITATTPCLKPFMSAISTNWGEQPKTEFTNSGASGSYGLRDLFGRSNKTMSQNTVRQATSVTEEQESQDAVDKGVTGSESDQESQDAMDCGVAPESDKENQEPEEDEEEEWLKFINPTP